MIASVTKNLEYKFNKKETEILFNKLQSRGFFQDQINERLREITYLNFISMIHTQEPIKDWENVGLKKLRE